MCPANFSYDVRNLRICFYKFAHSVFVVSPIRMDWYKKIGTSQGHKIFFFRKIPRRKKALFVKVGLAESIVTGQIYFHWLNLFSLVESILKNIRCTSQCHKKWFFSRKILCSKKLCLSMWDGYRFNQAARMSKNKIVISNSSCNKALIITFLLINAH